MSRPPTHRRRAASPGAAVKLAAAGTVFLALLLVPAPLLPPHRLAEVVQSLLGVGWQAAYLAAAIGLHLVFYAAIGMLAAFAVNAAPTRRGRLLQMGVVPLVVIGVALAVRVAKLGHLPMWINAAVPIGACLLGVILGLGLRYRRWTAVALIPLGLICVSLWALLGGASGDLSRATAERLQRLVAVGPQLPSGDARFAALLQTAFAPMPGDASAGDPVEHNRAAILALGIALGQERLARLVGLDPYGELVRGAAGLRAGTTLRGRGDWTQHYALSAGLAVLEHPLVSDAGGLMKEEMDALARGSGFSFGDLAADRAGVRFATAATGSEAAAEAMQARLLRGFAIDDFFPQVADLPENLTPERFRIVFGGVGSPLYRQVIQEIEARLDRCAALSSPQSRP